MPKKVLSKQPEAPITEAEVAVLSSILDKATTFSQNLDSQANVIIGLSLAVFVFATSSFAGGHSQAYAMILAFFSGSSALFGLLAMHPPTFMRRHKSEPQSLLFIKEIGLHKNTSAYAQELDNMISSRRTTIDQYACEIYNLSTRYYEPKNALFKMAKNMFLIGIAVSFLTFVLTTLFGI
ncbi:MAG: DUF5706 domain-containing protein [bacterium]|nr:DUF5706 domain-containing protein [bacterium]